MYKNYDTTVEKLSEKLEEYGVAVIPNVLTHDETKQLQTDMWTLLSYLTTNMEHPIQKDKPETWSSFYELYPLHSMLLQHYSIGHHQVVWDIRQNKNIVDIFSKIWNTKPEDLLVSFDGLSIHLPPEKTGKGWFSKHWYHTDQSLKRHDNESIQGFITAFDVKEHDATLAILEKSHKYHKDLADLYTEHSEKDWYSLSKEEIDFYKSKGCEERFVLASAGSLILWNSKTIHSGKEPGRKRKEENFRFVIYVCMTPRSKSNKKELKKKQEAFNNKIMTSHWPHKVIPFPTKPKRQFTKVVMPDIPPMEPPKLTELGLKLAGF